VAITTLGAITLGLFIRDLIRDRRDKLRMAAELEAARAVQLVLVPEQIPAIPGFALEAVYMPFSEVGGDFFQILPLPGNSVLAAVGDVSGKGVPAAMTVSHLVGILRFAAETSSSPEIILAALNRSLCDRGGQGFTTCLVLRCDHDGTLTVANAGHIAPFLNGKEISIENGLPLGLAASSIYPETTVSLPHKAQLTLLSDGVVEAQNAKGELFGFDRTAAISTQTAESIASTVQAFGQEDDITVVTLSLTTASSFA
jgi:serine phosphatase RsbU (regulator of sigma subunit)